MTGALGRDAQAERGGRADHRGHLMLVRGYGDGRGPLVDGDGPRLPGHLVAGLAGQVDLGAATGAAPSDRDLPRR